MEEMDWSVGRFGDARLAKRGRCCCSAVERVTMNLRAAADGRADWVGFSRWLNNPSVTAEEIAVHSAEALSERVAGLHVLAIQDTTELNYAKHAGRVRGLGPSGNGRDPG